MTSSFTKVFEQVGQLHKTDDDLIDRLNHRFTVILLVTFTTFISAKQFVGEPISCWTPAHFSGSQISYTNSICWLKGTYYLEVDQKLIPHRTENPEFRVAYYQFIPYMLLAMAVLFYLPHMLWRTLSRSIGFDLRSLIRDTKQGSEDDINRVASQIHTTLKYNSSKYVRHRYKSNNHLGKFFQCSILRQNFLCSLYLFIKLLYMLNCLCQFYLLSQFLSFSFLEFGYEWLVTITKNLNRKPNTEPKDSKWFPRVVMCEFMVRHLGSNQHGMVIQCNLPINLFNELIFVILWGWLISLTVLTCVSFILCLITIYSSIGSRFLDKYLHMIAPELSTNEQDDFINNYLRQDGILVLRIIAQNTNDTFMATLVGSLLSSYSYSIEQENKDNDNHTRVPSSGDYLRINSQR